MSQQPPNVPKWTVTLPKLHDVSMDVLFADIWERKALSKRDRSLVTCAILATMYRPDQLRYHLNFALDNGLTEEELSEMLTHLGFYAGYPSAVAAGNIAYDVFEQRQAAK